MRTAMQYRKYKAGPARRFRVSLTHGAFTFLWWEVEARSELHARTKLANKLNREKDGPSFTPADFSAEEVNR